MTQEVLDIIYTVLEYFLVFSFLGWCVEVVYQAVAKGLVINRGFLNGPVCPIYGFGVIAVFFLLQFAGEGDFEDQNALVVFAFGVILSTAVELLGGWALDKIFHARWWDYSKEPFNFHGYICLRFSMIWGLSILIVVRVIYPALRDQLSLIPRNAGWIIIIFFGSVYIADLIVSVSIMIGLNKRMAELDEMRRRMRIVSNSLSEHLGEQAITTAQHVGEARVQASLARTEAREQIEATVAETALELGNARTEAIEQIASARTGAREQLDNAVSGVRERAEQAAEGQRKRIDQALDEYRQYRDELEERRKNLYDRVLKSRHFGIGRLLRAFPDMQHRDHAEIVGELQEQLRSPEHPHDAE